MADVKKSAFMLSSATIMIAPAFSTPSVFELNPADHSVGMVGDVSVVTDSSITTLANGIAQATVDSKKTGVTSQITAQVYEMTAKNFLRGQAINKTPVTMLRMSLAADAPAGSTSIQVISNPVPGEDSSAVTDPLQIPTGSSLLIQRRTQTDYVLPIKTTGPATLNAGVFTIPIQPIPANMSFLTNGVVWLVEEIPVSNVDRDDFFCVKIAGIMTNFNRPVVYVAPKVRLSKGFGLNFSATEYTSMNFEMTALLMSSREATGRLSEIGNRQTGLVFAGSGGDPTGPALPTVTLSADITKPEGDSGPNLYIYTVTLSEPAPAGGTTVPWSFSQGSMDATDFTGGVLPAGGNVTIAQNATTGTFQVSVNGDTVAEGNETFTVFITPPSGYTSGGKTSATGTATNDDTNVPITFVSGNNLIAKNPQSVSGSTRRADRWPHIIPQPVTHLIPMFYNWCNAGLSGTNTGQAITVLSMVATYNGVTVPVTRGGASTWVIADGANDVQCDPILASAFNVAQIPAGAIIWTKTIISSVDATVPASTILTTAVAGSQSLCYNDANTTVSNPTDGAAFATTGTAPTADTTGFRPFMLGRLASVGKVEAVFGDSITELSLDLRSSIWGKAWFQRTMEILGYPSVNFAIAGSTTELGSTNPRIGAMLAYANRGVIMYGANDISTNGNGLSDSALKTRLQGRLAQMRSAGINIVGGCKLLTRTSSTDSFATEANQTPYPGWNAGEAGPVTNANIDTYGFSYIIPHKVAHGNDPLKWNVALGQPTNDGTHPLDLMHGAMATEAAPVISSETTPSNFPVYSIAAPTQQAEGNSGTTNFVFTVTRTITTGAEAISYATTGATGNPASADDFVGGAFPSGTVNFAIGEASKTITIPYQGDTTAEADEGFTVTISNPTAGGSIGTGAASTVALNDEGADTSAKFDPTWNTNSAVVYSPNRKNVTRTDAVGAKGARTVEQASAGLKYFEVAIAGSATPAFIGITDTVSNTTGAGGTAGLNRVGWVSANIVYNAGGSTGNKAMGGTVAANDVVQVAVRFDTKQIFFRKNGTGNWNNTAGADPTSSNAGTNGGLSFSALTTNPYILTTLGAAADASHTLRSATGEWTLTPPTGFGPWS